MSFLQHPRRFTAEVTHELSPLYPPTTRLAVLLVTYNHEKYIDKAIDSILFQEIELDYEIIIADDSSTDHTREIIRRRLEAAGKTNYRFLDYSKRLGVTKNYQRSIYACNADYVAVLEGDDYWVNVCKLRMQLNYLHLHRECVAASANYFVHVVERSEFYPRVPVKPEWSYIDARSLIRDNVIGNFSTCMFRKQALMTLPPKLFDGESYDWIFNITLMKYGLIGFYNEPLSVYNVHPGGTWSRLTNVERIDSQVSALERFNDITGQVFKADFDKLRDHLLEERQILVAAVPSPHEIRNVGVNEAIRRSKFPFLTRVLNAVHRRLPLDIISLVRRLLPTKARNSFIKIMTGN